MSTAAALHAAAVTDAGWRWRVNQDAVLLAGEVWSDPGPRTACCELRAGMLAGVADGAAIAPCASRASRTVLELLRVQVQAAQGLSAATARTIQRLMTDRAAGTRCEGTSSTLATMRFAGGQVQLLCVGDSRVYLWRDGQLRQISEDHTVARRMLIEGEITAEEAAQAASLYGDLDSALTASELEDRFDVFFETHALRPGDAWLCCTDGLTAALTQAQLWQCLATSGTNDVGQTANTLLQAARNQRCSDDNISLVLAAVL
ncbi:PP2C family protein-serine/threonine phosphatase [Azohydromonas lata]|uniref:PP2C family serine/threonine-protein phosphatase n=1 Tax=Azohydromonas lata TaxID=45677 RepID=A0ABU5I838_9BURK|nr:PP2C family serine/threonine-protein phosphatase [Azohydromonas lata]MDZ5455260.1 PP2C family serine/threonine-protein phosphatase [Azohydromonas lata]